MPHRHNALSLFYFPRCNYRPITFQIGQSDFLPMPLAMPENILYSSLLHGRNATLCQIVP